MKVANMLAKALYDNKAECSDELAFRKGDILTVLDQNIFGSEGWWRCYLHGRQGLAPANRLQLFTVTQNDSPLVQSNYNSLGRQQAPQNIYQVPSAPKTEPGSMYERMDNLYISPITPKPIPVDIYQTPICSPAQVFYERSNSSSSQHLFTLPRASQASNATSVPHPEVYDIPPSKLNVSVVSPRRTTPSPVNGCSLFLNSSEQQIYDIPSSPDTPGRSKVKTPKTSNVYDIPPMGTLAHRKNRNETPPASPQYNTLPNPRKSDWIYDIPLSPERNHLKGGCRKISIDRGMVYDVPPTRYGPVHSNCASGEIYDVPPQQSKSSPTTNQSLYDVPASQDIFVPHQNGSLRKGSSSYGIQRLEHIDAKENVYDIPRGSSAESPPKSEMSSLLYDERIYDVPPPLPRNSKPSLHSHDQDRLSVSSSESRTSTLSTSSNSSSESFRLSVPDENNQVTLEPEVAIKKITELQERVSSSIASLMIFVSSKWRLKENMEANLQDIHRAVNSIIISLGQFIDFVQNVKVNASRLTDTNIQMRIKNQLQTLTDSTQTLSQNQEAINLCNWSLQALIINRPHTTPDDLDQFVMVARTIPDDIKRFVSIIIANGKLLFKKPENEKKPKSVREQTVCQKPQVLLRKETRVLRESCVNKTNEKHKDEKHQLSRHKAMEDNGYVYLQKKEDFEKMQNLSPMHQLENKTSPEEKRKGWLKPETRIYSSNDPEKKSSTDILKEPKVFTTKPEAPRSKEPIKKIALSENCYLYFGALQKAIRVFKDSLTKNETPEVFITHGKLIIMVGQKLVDLLCQDVKANEARNDILFKSSELCSLLKNLAMATKTAAIQYPNIATMQELQRRTNELSNYAQLFREMVE